MSIQFQQRRDTSANWTLANPILADGEQGFETDTKKIKIGNGVDNWDTLSYIGIGEINTASNVGDGEGFYTTKSGVDLQFKSLKVAGGISISSDSEIITISGSNETSSPNFIDLLDTPETYDYGKYLRTTESGIYFEDTYVENIVYASPTASGLYRDGSVTNPFKDALEVFTHIDNTYTDPDDVVVIYLLPGVYSVPYKVSITNPSLKAIIGVGAESVIIKPSVATLGDNFIELTTPILTSNLTVDATDIPTYLTTSGTTAVKLSSPGQVSYKDVIIKGFYTGYSTTSSGCSLDLFSMTVLDCNIGLSIEGGSYVNIENSYILDCYSEYLHVNNSVVNIKGSIISTQLPLTPGGLGIHAEGDNCLIELNNSFIGYVDKSILIENSSTININNSNIYEAASSPSIDQRDTANITIVNSKAPLNYTNFSVSNPSTVYVNALDVITNRTVIGNGADSDQTIFSIYTGKSSDPYLEYEPDHNTDYKALGYHNPVLGENSELYVSSNDGKANLGVHPEGTSAHSYEASLGLVSIQSGDRKGWNITKGTGTTPDLFCITKDSVKALTLKYNGDAQLNSGVSVNKILDEDTLVSNDAKALATQQSIKNYFDNTTYSRTALDAGQLDNRYYTELEINTSLNDINNTITTLSGILSNASNIDYTSTKASQWAVDNVEQALDYVLDYSGNTTGTGRVSPDVPLTTSDYQNLTVLGGVGYIAVDGSFIKVTWSGSSIDTSSKTPGTAYHIYVDSNATIIENSVEPNKSDYIYLGYYYYVANQIGLIYNYDATHDQFLNKFSDYTTNMGAFIYDNGGALGIVAGQTDILVSTACKVQKGLSQYNFIEINTADPNYFSPVYTTTDLGWLPDVDVPYNRSGHMKVNFYNDTTASGYIPLSNSAEFTNGSSTVVTPDNIESLLVSGDMVCYISDFPYWFNTISGVSWTGSQTEIYLDYPYTGTTATGTLIASKALKYIPAGKYAKHYAIRDGNGILYIVYGNTLFDSLEAAEIGSLPAIPEVTEISKIAISSIISDDAGNLSFQDLRPIPFSTRTIGGSSSGGEVTDHGALTGLSDDDHTQYVLSNGTRNFSGKVSYSISPTFTADNEIINKKYVDDSILALTFDHGNLSGLSDDDHPQYLNTTRGDVRYYTQTQVDTLFSNHYAATSTDHDDRYYTEPEVDALITTLSGSIQDQLDAQGAGTSYYSESNTLSTTTSTTFQDKTSVTFGSGETGTYRLAYSMSFNSNASNKNVEVRFYNSTDAVVLDSNSQQTNSSTNWFSFSGIVWVSITGTNKTFKLQYAAGSADCSVRYARIEAWRKN